MNTVISQSTDCRSFCFSTNWRPFRAGTPGETSPLIFKAPTSALLSRVPPTYSQPLHAIDSNWKSDTLTMSTVLYLFSPLGLSSAQSCPGSPGTRIFCSTGRSSGSQSPAALSEIVASKPTSLTRRFSTDSFWSRVLKFGRRMG